MRAGEKLLNGLFIFLEQVKTWNLTLTTHSRFWFFEVLIVQCQNSIKYILRRSLSAAMFTWPCKTNFTTVPDPLELQILLEDQTATEILFQSYAATTTIDRMTWLACIWHYVTGHVHKTGPNYNGTNRGARSIQPKFRPVRPGKEDHLKRWTCFFETFQVGPNRSIEFWTEISGNFGWMDRAPLFVPL